MSNGFKLTGDVHITRYNEVGDQTGEWDFKNLVVTTGLEWVASRMVSNTPAVMKYIAVGTNAAAPALNQTALFGELTRVAVSPVGGSVSGSTITYTAEFGPGVGTGTLQEAGILQESAASAMLSRVTFASIVKAASDTIMVQWTIAGS